jgi:hypothetical protein
MVMVERSESQELGMPLAQAKILAESGEGINWDIGWSLSQAEQVQVVMIIGDFINSASVYDSLIMCRS